MSVLFQSLLWIGLPLVAVPILIHLINLRRQRRIPWAAMQFLLESQRKNRRWIFLKQLLLLLARMAAVALLVFLLAQVSVRNEWLSLLGRGTTHHLILLDDSYSMSDRWNETTAIDEGKRAIQAIIEQASAQSDRQLVTLLTFSEAARLAGDELPKVHLQRLNDSFRSQLPTILAGVEVSERELGPGAALSAVPKLLSDDVDQTVILYLVGDFRARQFADASDVKSRLTELQDRTDQVHFIRCVKDARANLALTTLAPVAGVRAAGIEMQLRVSVANYSDEPARGVLVQLEQDGDALPALSFETIAPREEISHLFYVQFAGAGAHWLSATLPADAVAVDNRRWFACDLSASRPVAIVDGSYNRLGGRQLALALAPGGATRTGWQPHIESPRFLADPDRLAEQAAVCLIDVPRLVDDELAGLEEYVRRGGGLAIFVGSDIDRAYYNDRLVNNGVGLLPAPLRLPMQLPDRQGDAAPDAAFDDHPLFRVFAGRNDSLASLLSIDYYYALADDWTPPADGSTRVLARLRNQSPLVLEKTFGKGRVVAHLTRLANDNTPLGPWSNWSVTPFFPVLANELMNYLSTGGSHDPVQFVGEDLFVAVPEEKFEPTMQVSQPDAHGERGELSLDAVAVGDKLVGEIPHVTRSGLYYVQLQPREGPTERRDFAFNVVATGEGDLAVTRREELATQFADLDVQLHDASDMSVDEERLAGIQLSESLLGALVALLLAEQALAYSASYHHRS